MSFKDDIDAAIGDIAKGFSGGRYQKQKIGTLGLYVFLCLVTVGWSLSGGGTSMKNAIGAEIVPNVVEDEHWLQVTNRSDEPWTGARLIVNGDYELVLDNHVEPGDSVQVFVKEFAYRLYVPRPYTTSSAVVIVGAEEQRATAPANLRPTSLSIVTDQGAHAVSFVTGTSTEGTRQE